LLTGRLRESGLLETKKIDVSEVGVHPDNREGMGLVTPDVHDLLLLMTENGFNRALLSLLCCSIPPNETGAAWRQFNDHLSVNSEGFLPEARSFLMKVLTVWGSHTTSAIRIAKYGAKAMHLCIATDGVVSQAKILEAKPSFAEAFDGMMYDVIHHELVEAVPDLMHVLSRCGNTSHGVHRSMTNITKCLAIWRSYQCNSQKTEQECESIACQGQSDDFKKSYGKLKDFVKVHAGGDSGKYLKQFETFERGLNVKRNIDAMTFQKLSTVRLPGEHSCRYVPALVKSYLNAPLNKAPNGVAELLGNSELSALNNRNSLVQKAAVEAATKMHQASVYLEAYSQTASITMQLQSVLDTFEQRLVAHVHKITADTRKSFKSVEAICNAFYWEAKEVDSTLPRWSFAGAGEAGNVDQPTHSHLLELSEAGIIPDSELARGGFEIGACVKKGNVETTIHAFDGVKSVVLKPRSSSSTEQAPNLVITRSALMTDWKVFNTVERVTLGLTLPNDFMKSVILGVIKESLLAEFVKEKAILKVTKLGTALNVIYDGDRATSSLTIMAVSNNIGFYKDPKPAPNILLAHCDYGYIYMHVCVPTHKELVVEPSDSTCVVAYPIVNSSKTDDLSRVNVEYQAKHMTILVKPLDMKMQVCVPAYHATRSIKKGDILYASQMKELVVEPSTKVQKTNGKGKGNKGRSTK
jgi:hypothetical protein